MKLPCSWIKAMGTPRRILHVDPGSMAGADLSIPGLSSMGKGIAQSYTCLMPVHSQSHGMAESGNGVSQDTPIHVI